MQEKSMNRKDQQWLIGDFKTAVLMNITQSNAFLSLKNRTRIATWNNSIIMAWHVRRLKPLLQYQRKRLADARLIVVLENDKN